MENLTFEETNYEFVVDDDRWKDNDWINKQYEVSACEELLEKGIVQ